MKAASRVLMGLAGLTCAAATLLPRPVLACSAPLFPVVRLVTDEIPADGVVAGLLRFKSAVGVQDAYGNWLEGEVQARDDLFFVFIPAEPLTVGATYTIKSIGTVNDENEVIEVYEDVVTFTAIEPLADSLAVEATVTAVQSGVGRWECGVVGECSDGLYESSLFSAALQLEVSGSARSQYEFEVTYWSLVAGSAEPVGLTPSAPEMFDTPGHSFEGAPSELCYSLTATPFVGGATIDLGSECLPVTGLALGPSDEPYGDQAAFFSSCLETPTLEGRSNPDFCPYWQERVASAECATGGSGCTLPADCEPDYDDCTCDTCGPSGGAYDPNCPFESPPTNGSADDGATDPNAPGCSLSAAPSAPGTGGSRGSALWFLPLALLGLGLRRARELEASEFTRAGASQTGRSP